VEKAPLLSEIPAYDDIPETIKKISKEHVEPKTLADVKVAMPMESVPAVQKSAEPAEVKAPKEPVKKVKAPEVKKEPAKPVSKIDLAKEKIQTKMKLTEDEEAVFKTEINKLKLPDYDKAEQNNILMINMVDETKRLLKNNIVLMRENDKLTAGLIKHDNAKKELKEKIKETSDHYRKEMVKQERRFGDMLRKKENEFEEELYDERKQHEDILMNKEFELHEKDTYYPLIFEMQRQTLEEDYNSFRGEVMKLINRNKELSTNVQSLKGEVNKKRNDFINLVSEFKKRFLEFETILDINEDTIKFENQKVEKMIENAIVEDLPYEKVKEQLLEVGEKNN